MGSGASTDALDTIGWDPPRYTTTAFEMAYAADAWFPQLEGWIGLESFDERNDVGQAFLDRFSAKYGRRSDYFLPCFGHDVATVIAHALAAARPLTGAGVRDGMEHIELRAGRQRSSRDAAALRALHAPGLGGK